MMPARVICYLDESGDNGPPAVSVVAGYGGYEDAWREIEAEGRALLSRYGLPYLHATDLFRAKAHHKGWSDEHIGKLAAETVALILHYRPVGLVVGIDNARHRLRKSETGLSASQSPLGACFSMVNDALARMFHQLPDHQLLYRWESRGRKDEEIRLALNSIRDDHQLHAMIEDIEFVAKADFIGAQLADFLAFLGRRQAQALLRGDAPDNFYPVLEPLLDTVGLSFLATDMG